MREFEMPTEILLLQIERSSIPVTIEPRLSNRTDGRVAREGLDLIPGHWLGLSRVIRVDTHGREHARMLAGDLDDRDAIRQRGCHGENLADPSLVSGLEDLVESPQINVVGQVSVGIYQFGCQVHVRARLSATVFKIIHEVRRLTTLIAVKGLRCDWLTYDGNQALGRSTKLTRSVAFSWLCRLNAIVWSLDSAVNSRIG